MEYMTLDLRVECGAFLKKKKERKLHRPWASAGEKPSLPDLLLSGGLSFPAALQLPPPPALLPFICWTCLWFYWGWLVRICSSLLFPNKPSFGVK